jgi:hypothetical protein
MKMRMPKMLVLLSTVILLLNGCDKVSSLVANSSKTSAATPAPSPAPNTKDGQGFWSKIFGSSKSIDSATATSSNPTSNLKNKKNS